MYKSKTRFKAILCIVALLVTVLPYEFFNSVKVLADTNNKVVSSSYFNNNTKLNENAMVNGSITIDKDFDLNGHYLYVKGDINIKSNVDINNGCLNVTGKINHSNGYLKINGGACYVGKDYNLSSSAILYMNSTNDGLSIKGNFNVSNSNNYLYNGLINLYGSFTQKGNYNFRPSSELEMTFVGTSTQKISFEDSSSYFYGFISNNKNTVFSANDSDRRVKKWLGSSLINMNNKELNISGFSGHRLEVYGNVTINKDIDLSGKVIKIHGNVNHTDGKISFNGGSLYIDGSYTSKNSASLNMTNDADLLNVSKTFTVGNSSAYGYGTSNSFEKGTIVLEGDFKQTTIDNNFVADGTHTVILSGKSKQTVTFKSTSSYINQFISYNKNAVLSTNAGFKKLIKNSVLASANNKIMGAFPESKLDLNGYGLEVYGNVTIDKDIDINGGHLYIDGVVSHNSGNVYLHGGKLGYIAGKINTTNDGSNYSNHRCYYEIDKEEATCSHGLKVIKKCNKCGSKQTITQEGKITNAYQIEYMQAPTCFDKEKSSYICSECGMTDEEEQPVQICSGHFYSGTGADAKCSICGAKKHTHTYKITKTVESTCRKDGYKESKCTSCGQIKREKIGKKKCLENCTEKNELKRDSYRTKVAEIPASLVSEGCIIYKCKYCNYSEKVVVDKLKDISEAKVELANSKEYFTETPNIPTLNITYGSTKLILNKDYKVTNNSKTSSLGENTVTIKGAGRYGGGLEKTFTVDKKKISSCGFSKLEVKTYDGKAKKQSITITNNGKKLTLNKDYTLSYSSNVKCGKAKVVIKGKGNYEGEKTLHFVIVPKKVTLKKVYSSKKKQIGVKWKKTTGASGYEITASKKSSFSSGVKKVVVKSKNATAKVLYKMARRKKYYVRIRAYITIDGKKYYGKYSSKKSVRVK